MAQHTKGKISPKGKPLVSTLKSPGAAGAGAHAGVFRTRPHLVEEGHFLNRERLQTTPENLHGEQRQQVLFSGTLEKLTTDNPAPVFLLRRVYDTGRQGERTGWIHGFHFNPDFRGGEID
jgi:hypothetical protein